MVKTRAQTRKLKSRVASYRKRVKQSKCRGLTRTCRKAKGCKMTKSGKRKTYCRKLANRKLRSLKGGRSRSRRAGFLKTIIHPNIEVNNTEGHKMIYIRRLAIIRN